MATKERINQWYTQGIVCIRCKLVPARYGRKNMCEHCYNIDNDERKRIAGEVCQVPGCIRGVRMRGFCMSHYVRYVRRVEQRSHGCRWRPILPDGCVVCGWNKAACDYHHILERCNGGNGKSDNVVYVCPNCHRLIHLGLLEASTLPTLAEIEDF